MREELVSNMCFTRSYFDSVRARLEDFFVQQRDILCGIVKVFDAVCSACLMRCERARR